MVRSTRRRWAMLPPIIAILNNNSYLLDPSIPAITVGCCLQALSFVAPFLARAETVAVAHVVLLPWLMCPLAIGSWPPPTTRKIENNAPFIYAWETDDNM